MILLFSIPAALITIAQQLGPGVLTLLGLAYRSYLEKKKTPDLTRVMGRTDQVKKILDQILYELEGCRCCEWAVSNGDVTLSGYHLQKLSILTEACKDGTEAIQPLFQLVPISQFKRMIDLLRQDDVVVSLENKIQDDLAALNLNYEMVTLVEVRIHGEFNKWTGVLSLSWDAEREVTSSEIAFLKMQAARIGAIKN